MKTFSQVSTLLTCLAILIIPTVLAQPTLIATYKWKNRPLLLFSPTSKNEAILEAKKQLVTEVKGLTDRDMVAIVVYTDIGYIHNSRTLSKKEIIELRAYYQVEPVETKSLLIGKDGGTKIKETLPVDLQAIFALIDGMPMRQREMRNKQ